jgi:transposase
MGITLKRSNGYESEVTIEQPTEVEVECDVEQLHDLVKHLLPKQRGNVAVDNLTIFKALHHKAKTKCPWRKLPKEFGKWFTIQQRFFRWRDTGVLGQVENALRAQGYSNFFWTRIPTK